MRDDDVEARREQQARLAKDLRAIHHEGSAPRGQPAGHPCQFGRHRPLAQSVVRIGKWRERPEALQAKQAVCRSYGTMYERSALILDSEAHELGHLALSLVSLGLRPLYADCLDELVLLSREYRDQVGAVLVPSPGLQERLPVLAKRLLLPLGLPPSAILPVGPRLRDDECEALRCEGLRWSLWEPFEPQDLRFAVGRVLSQTDPEERRLEARVPCAIPAQVEVRGRRTPVRLTDLSTSGAFAHLERPHPERTSLSVHFELGGKPVALQARVAWCTRPETGGWCDPGMGLDFQQVEREIIALLQREMAHRLQRFCLGAGGPQGPAEEACLPTPTSDVLEDFLRLDRRRLRGDSPLTQDELVRWGELRDRIEQAAGSIRPFGVERREALRVRTKLEVVVTWDEAQELARARDLSEGGLFLRTSHPSELGTEVELELQDARGRPLHLEGTVVWVRLETDGAGAAGIGIKFRDLEDWDRTLLAELVELLLHEWTSDASAAERIGCGGASRAG